MKNASQIYGGPYIFLFFVRIKRRHCEVSRKNGRYGIPGTVLDRIIKKLARRIVAVRGTRCYG